MTATSSLQERLERTGTCVLLPTYNNSGTLADVIQRILAITGPHLLVIDDGSTDSTAQVLAGIPGLEVLRNELNQGKGYSLRRGFAHLLAKGYKHAITLDSDGQHAPEDIVRFVEVMERQPGTMVMGDRNMAQAGIPGRSSFGNKFSSFWFKVETGITLPDTQTGYRCYPLAQVTRIRTFTHRFEFEIESIVRLAWRDVPFATVPVSVRYDFPERVSHFRPVIDFARISVLNTVLVIIAGLWFWPRKLFVKGELRKMLRSELVRPGESNARKAASIGFGFFMGTVPIWGFQLALGIPLAFLFKLNRVLFLTAAHISIPPMVPLILWASHALGAQLLPGGVPIDLLDISLEAVKQSLAQYVVGAVVLAAAMAVVGGLLAWGVLVAVRRTPGAEQRMS
ncbi:MAG: DUF2062 domain-containing protein [Flavobacteriales bacterium]|nr:MAG: DUF2062 domain-containing protein [Flavobacteriales bacterium]